jgi:hypothetical protein
MQQRYCIYWKPAYAFNIYILKTHIQVQYLYIENPHTRSIFIYWKPAYMFNMYILKTRIHVQYLYIENPHTSSIFIYWKPAYTLNIYILKTHIHVQYLYIEIQHTRSIFIYWKPTYTFNIYILKTHIHVQYFPFRIWAKYCKLDTLTRDHVCISRIPAGYFFPHQQLINFGDWFFEHTEISADCCVQSVKLCTAAL